MMHDTVVVGVGRRGFGDDAAGPTVLGLLGAHDLPVDLQSARPDPTDLARLLHHRRRALIVDACLSDTPTGTHCVVDLNERLLDLPVRPAHGMTLEAALSLVTVLGPLPRSCLLLAITGRDFGPGADMTPAVTDACRQCADLIARWARGPCARLT
jgi:hydrogenase maturation protease